MACFLSSSDGSTLSLICRWENRGSQSKSNTYKVINLVQSCAQVWMKSASLWGHFHPRPPETPFVVLCGLNLRLMSLLEFSLVPLSLLSPTAGYWCSMMQMWTDNWISLDASTHLESCLCYSSPSCCQTSVKIQCKEEKVCFGLLFEKVQSNMAGKACDRNRRQLVILRLKSGSRGHTGSGVGLLNSRPAPITHFFLYLLTIPHRSTLPPAAREPVLKQVSLWGSCTIQHNSN